MTFTTNLSEETLALAAKIEEKIRPFHAKVEDMAFFNQQKCLLRSESIK